MKLIEVLIGIILGIVLTCVFAVYLSYKVRGKKRNITINPSSTGTTASITRSTTTVTLNNKIEDLLKFAKSKKDSVWVDEKTWGTAKKETLWSFAKIPVSKVDEYEKYVERLQGKL